MTREYKRNMLIIRDHIDMLRTLPTEEEKVLRIKYIIVNELLSAGYESHIVSRPVFIG